MAEGCIFVAHKTNYIMNKISTIFLLAFAGLSAALNAQTWKSDSITMTAGYSNQVFYKMGTGTAGSSLISNWDIAHYTSVRDNGLKINHMNGLELYNYPNGDNTAWATFDTAGAYTWAPLWNSIDKKNIGAFNQSTNTADVWDFSWGIYNSGTHTVVGDSLYLIVQRNQMGQMVKTLKFMPIIQQTNGDFIFKVANIDGSNEVTDTLKQSNASNQEFKYYSFSGAKPVREPGKSDWDITFTRYYELQGQRGVIAMYPTMGVESNGNTRVAKVFGKTATELNPELNDLTRNYYGKLTDSLTAIGSNWKVFDGMRFVIGTKQLYMVESRIPGDSAYYLLQFTGFGGTANGKVVFNTYKLQNTISVKDITIGEMSLYPNPANDFAIVTLKNSQVAAVNITVTNMMGKVVLTDNVNTNGLMAYKISTNELASGVYQVSVNSGKSQISQKLIIK
jgi:hypothetical protein